LKALFAASCSATDFALHREESRSLVLHSFVALFKLTFENTVDESPATVGNCCSLPGLGFTGFLLRNIEANVLDSEEKRF